MYIEQIIISKLWKGKLDCGMGLVKGDFCMYSILLVMCLFFKCIFSYIMCEKTGRNELDPHFQTQNGLDRAYTYNLESFNNSVTSVMELKSI